MDITSLLYDMFSSFLYGENAVLELWQQQFLTLAVTATAFIFLYTMLRYILDFVYSFFRRL